MTKKLSICFGKACKDAGTHQKLKKWANKIKTITKIKKTRCLGICKKNYAIEFKGEIFSCGSKKELEKIIAE
jgi:NADH:ubiquinone oxidoreductase subunit E